MTRRQFDAISPGGPGRAAAARRTGSPGGEPAAQTRPDAIMRIAPGEDRRPRLAAPAVALNGVGGDRLAVSATSLLQLQRQYGNRYVQGVIGRAQADQVAEACRDRGQRIDPKMNERLGRALGADFSEVTVHTDRAADRLSQALDADAFTVGSHIFFRANRYNPSTPAGQRLMAHELAHVVQQGARIGPASALRLGPANDASEREADRVAAVPLGGTSTLALRSLLPGERFSRCRGRLQSASRRCCPGWHWNTGTPDVRRQRSAPPAQDPEPAAGSHRVLRRA
jgi:Domain of unknown function (DUF4157)